MPGSGPRGPISSGAAVGSGVRGGARPGASRGHGAPGSGPSAAAAAAGGGNVSANAGMPGAGGRQGYHMGMNSQASQVRYFACVCVCVCAAVCALFCVSTPAHLSVACRFWRHVTTCRQLTFLCRQQP